MRISQKTSPYRFSRKLGTRKRQKGCHLRGMRGISVVFYFLGVVISTNGAFPPTLTREVPAVSPAALLARAKKEPPVKPWNPSNHSSNPFLAGLLSR